MLKTIAGMFIFAFSGFLCSLTAGEEVQNERSQEPVEITNRSRTPQYIDGEAFYFHAVLQGQTLYSIARAYGVDEEDIIDQNPDIRDGLRYDQVIRIPMRDDPDTLPPVDKIRLDEVAPMPDGKYVEHEVKRHETIFGLSREYGVSQERILFYNPQAREVLQVGHVLRIPLDEQDPAAEGYRLYTVASGETKYGIAREQGLTVDELTAINPEIEEELIAGQQIRVPLEVEVAEAEEEKQEERFIFLPPRKKDQLPDIDEYCLDPKRKESYDVALIIPLYLESLDLDDEQLYQVNSLKYIATGEEEPDQRKVQNIIDKFSEHDLPLDHQSFSFISFYQGVLVALDSIINEGINIRLHVFDGCDNIAKVQELTAADTLAQMDLIIGPFHERPLRHVSDYAQIYDIPVVSPMLPERNQLKGNENLFKVRPSLETMLTEVGVHIAQNYPRQNIILVHDNQPGAAELIYRFKDSLLTSVANVNHFYDSLNLRRVDGYHLDGTFVGSRRSHSLVIPDTAAVSWVSPDLFNQSQERKIPRPANVTEVIYRDEGMEGLLKAMRQDKKNVLITLIGGEPFVSNYLRQLHENRRNYHMSIFGIPEWENYASIEIDYLQNLNVHFFNEAFYDYHDLHVRDFVKSYREFFLAEPDEDAFKGVQTAYFFFSALEEYGKDFPQCISLMNQMGFESPFSFRRPQEKGSGFANSHTAIYRIKNYRWVDVTRPMELAAEEE